jgi:hypothetical protein
MDVSVWVGWIGWAYFYGDWMVKPCVRDSDSNIKLIHMISGVYLQVKC